MTRSGRASCASARGKLTTNMRRARFVAAQENAKNLSVYAILQARSRRTRVANCTEWSICEQMGQLAPQLQPGPVQPRLHRFCGALHNLGNLRIAQVVVFRENNNGPLVFR